MTTEQTPDQNLQDYLDSLGADLYVTNEEYDEIAASEALRHLKSLEKRIADNSTVAEHERKKISQWEMMVNEPLAEKALEIRSQLEEYARYVREKNPTKKTIQLPYGVIKTQPAKPKWSVTDADAFAEWATKQQMDDLVRRRVEPALQAIKNALVVGEDGTAVDPVSGEVVPGVSVAEPDVPFTVVIKPE